jgi:hypothetical protein
VEWRVSIAAYSALSTQTKLVQVLHALQQHTWWNLLEPPRSSAIELLASEWMPVCNGSEDTQCIDTLSQLHSQETPALHIVAACNCVVQLLHRRVAPADLAGCAKALAHVSYQQNCSNVEPALEADIGFTKEQNGARQAYQQMLVLMARTEAVGKLVSVFIGKHTLG